MNPKSALVNGKVAAFFDLDGTLLPLPSLERRYFCVLRYKRAFRVSNYFFWIGKTIRMLPHGLAAIVHANKMYLRGVRIPAPEILIPPFFREAIERAAWHARKGHAIVIMSGTLEALAQQAARALETLLAARGIHVTIFVCATRLQAVAGRYTGQILGQAMFGQEKVRAMRRLAADMGLDLGKCYAYGNAANDRWLLAAVGNPTGVNPRGELAPIAAMHRWPVVRWSEDDHELRPPNTFSCRSHKIKKDAIRRAELKKSERIARSQAESVG
ncbi:MAG TPA: HAD-IB family phosphatase [Candidatus Dormibacteraeota bacterium]|nr:HAD-IB family phosphatase [Candidatus Dormibacteraeota bacterium]